MNDKIKSTITNINYLHIPKSTCADNVKSASTKIIKHRRVYYNNINNKSAYSKINYEFSALLKIKKVSNTNIIIKKKLNPQAINIKYELNALNKIKKVTNASKHVIDFLNTHITQILNGNKVHMQNLINNTVANTVIHDNIEKAHAKLANSTLPINKVHIENNSANNTSKKTHKKLFNNVLKQIKTFNKVYVENSNASNASKETHKKLFNNVLKQIKTVSKVHKQDIISDYNKCKKLHKKLFNNMIIELSSIKNAGHKDLSANINEAHANDVKRTNSSLHNHITYYFNKI